MHSFCHVIFNTLHIFFLFFLQTVVFSLFKVEFLYPSLLPQKHTPILHIQIFIIWLGDISFVIFSTTKVWGIVGDLPLLRIK